VTYARSKPATEGSFWKELIFIDFSYFGWIQLKLIHILFAATCASGFSVLTEKEINLRISSSVS
jgi:hypothetical protein